MAGLPSRFTHLRDIFILPFSVTVIVPYGLYHGYAQRIPETLFLKMIGVLLALGGLLLFSATVFLFDKIGKGTLAPWSEKQKLVVQGPYRYCRNPMITGVLSILLGEGLYFHSAPILVWATVFFVINTFYFIFYEEPFLARKFGNDYTRYKHEVPRWIPRLKMPRMG
jgi:protein-S-isoprenylcysteine O-methyltransferase Ste14